MAYLLDANVVVVGKLARGVEASDAWTYVAGLTCGQDISDRRLQMGSGWPLATKSEPKSRALERWSTVVG